MRLQVLENIFLCCILFLIVMYLCFALQMPFGTLSSPDSGFLPVLLGIAGIIFTIGILIRNLKSNIINTFIEIPKQGMVRFLIYAGVLVLFMLTFNLLGYVSIFLMILIQSKISGFIGWLKPILFAVLLTLSIYLLFGIVLSVPLPLGIFFDAVMGG